MKFNKVNNLNKNCLYSELLKYKKKYFSIRFQQVLEKSKNTSQVKKIKKNIARIFTSLNKIKSKIKNI